MLTNDDLLAIKEVVKGLLKPVEDGLGDLKRTNALHHKQIINRMDFVDLKLDKDLMETVKRVDNIEDVMKTHGFAI